MLDLQSAHASIQRMESGFDLIVNFEDAWDQNVWRGLSATSACGTKHCFAGWVENDSPYELAIQDLKAFRDAIGSDYLGIDHEGALFSAVAIPPGDPLTESNSARDSLTDYYSSWESEHPVVKELRRITLTFPPGTKFLSAEHLAFELLGVIHGATLNPNHLLDNKVFSWSNTLETIREYIDAARARAHLPARDFAVQPVEVRIDDLTPEAQHDIIRERVQRFNERATTQGLICTENELAALVHVPDLGE